MKRDSPQRHKGHKEDTNYPWFLCVLCAFVVSFLEKSMPIERMWHHHDLKSTYDVVIVGAGVHGLAIAYYLGKNHGITNVALLDKGYLGGGASGRNTAIIRSNYRTPQGVAFYDESVKL